MSLCPKPLVGRKARSAGVNWMASVFRAALRTTSFVGWSDNPTSQSRDVGRAIHGRVEVMRG
jgi:hypothetical protein